MRYALSCNASCRCAWPRVITGVQALCTLLQHLMYVIGARLSSLSPTEAGGAVLFFVVPCARPRVPTPLVWGPGAPRSPVSARRTSLVPVAGGSRWHCDLFCLAARLAACPNPTLMQRLLQLLGARLLSPSAAAAGGAVLFFVPRRAWLRVLTTLDWHPGASRSPAGAQRTSLDPVSGGGSRWPRALLCRAAPLAPCSSPTWSGHRHSTLPCSASCRCSAHVFRPRRRRQQMAPCSFLSRPAPGCVS